MPKKQKVITKTAATGAVESMLERIPSPWSKLETVLGIVEQSIGTAWYFGDHYEFHQVIGLINTRFKATENWYQALAMGERAEIEIRPRARLRAEMKLGHPAPTDATEADVICLFFFVLRALQERGKMTERQEFYVGTLERFIKE